MKPCLKSLWASVVLAAFALNAAEGARPPRPTPGFLTAEIGNHRTLRYKCAGSGVPTVIIETALGVSIEETYAMQQPVGWAVIAPKIARATKTCVYDRAGLGLSSKLTVSTTSLDAARDLDELVTILKLPRPYILAAHSLGGMDALMFAALFPESVAGVVLVDSAHPEQQAKFAEVLPPRGASDSDLLKGFRDGPSGPVNGEWFDFQRNTQQMRHLPNLGDKPLIVLTHDPKVSTTNGLVPREWELATEPVWQQLQNQYAFLSTRSKHVIVENAGHRIQFEQPEVVAQAILEVLSQVRNRHN